MCLVWHIQLIKCSCSWIMGCWGATSVAAVVKPSWMNGCFFLRIFFSLPLSDSVWADAQGVSREHVLFLNNSRLIPSIPLPSPPHFLILPSLRPGLVLCTVLLHYSKLTAGVCSIPDFNGIHNVLSFHSYYQWQSAVEMFRVPMHEPLLPTPLKICADLMIWDLLLS